MMPDREKVIKGIETCEPSVFARKCSDCPYKDEMNCDYALWHDVIDMLKEQEHELKCTRLALKILNGEGIRVNGEAKT